jgi:uncharacterized peroxidase-related enzyme
MTADRIHALDLPEPERAALEPDVQAYFAKCDDKIGFVPNVLRAYSFSAEKLRGFTAMYNELMLGKSGVTKVEREMIAVAVSAVNHCFYCLTAHGAALRQLSGDPILAETIAHNWRAAPLPPRQVAMLAFATKLTERPDTMVEADRQALRDAGWTDADIWDIAATAAFFNMSNRMAAAIDMRPNDAYHAQAR